ncbi:P63C domain-containing protein [Halomonas elongata]|uniref:P63C domain-containing protein n=1 Tax=Halomonas elongata TaxID=2746 RepID=UPI004034DCC4
MTDHHSKGGKARASKLTPDQRSEIARKAAIARHENKNLPRATHEANETPLRIGNAEIPCYVLEDGTRVLSQRGMVSSLGMKRGGAGGGDRLSSFAGSKSISPYINNELLDAIKNPVKFRTLSGSIALGYKAEALADLCDAALQSRQEGSLHPQQEHIAKQAEILVRSFARVGIIALVDEATGYEEVRERYALQALLDKYIRKEYAAWVKTFPDEFFKEIFRLKKWTWKGTNKRPGVVGRYINDIIYSRLGPGVLDELQSRNPPNARGNRSVRHHQWLTDDMGVPALAQHMYATIGMMRAFDTWEEFKSAFDRAYPPKDATLPLL